jgi:hypothetical protein
VKGCLAIFDTPRLENDALGMVGTARMPSATSARSGGGRRLIGCGMW